MPAKPRPEVPHLHVFLNTSGDGDSTTALGSPRTLQLVTHSPRMPSSDGLMLTVLECNVSSFLNKVLNLNNTQVTNQSRNCPVGHKETANNFTLGYGIFSLLTPSCISEIGNMEICM